VAAFGACLALFAIGVVFYDTAVLVVEYALASSFAGVGERAIVRALDYHD
jgi:hypothetical protein